MARKVIWSKRAIAQIDETYRYIQDELSLQGAINFVQAAYALEKRMAEFPESGRPCQATPNIRYLIFTKHRRLYYRIYLKVVKVLAVFDARQDPAKRPF